MDYTVGNMGLAVGHMFVKETFDESAKSKVRLNIKPCVLTALIGTSFGLFRDVRKDSSDIIVILQSLNEPTKQSNTIVSKYGGL